MKTFERMRVNPQPDSNERELCGKFELLPELTKQQLGTKTRSANRVGCKTHRSKRNAGKEKSSHMLDKLSERADRSLRGKRQRDERRAKRRNKSNAVA